jgi:hypothetical protein
MQAAAASYAGKQWRTSAFLVSFNDRGGAVAVRRRIGRIQAGFGELTKNLKPAHGVPLLLFELQQQQQQKMRSHDLRYTMRRVLHWGSGLGRRSRG